MKHFITVLSLLLMVIHFSGCHNKSHLKTTFPNILSPEEEIELIFQMYNVTKDFAPLPIRSITIMNDDTTIFKIVANKYVTKYNFPTLPDEFDLVFPDSKEKIGPFKKNENLFFSFIPAENAYGRDFQYYSYFADPESRWRFDKNSEIDSKMFAFYESWAGNDIISIKFISEILIDEKSFKVEYSDGISVPFEIKKKKNPTDRIILNLERDAKNKTIITLYVLAELVHVSNENSEYLKYKIFYNNFGYIGLAGKNNFIR